MATPHVTGVAALLKAQNPERNWAAIKNLLLSGGEDIGVMNRLLVTGKRISALGSLTCSNKPFFPRCSFQQCSQGRHRHFQP